MFHNFINTVNVLCIVIISMIVFALRNGHGWKQPAPSSSEGVLTEEDKRVLKRRSLIVWLFGGSLAGAVLTMIARNWQ